MAKSQKPKSYHRWTPEENKRLLEEMTKMKPLFAQAGQPGQPIASVLWSQVPGKIGVFATPEACMMQYRVLTSDEPWALKRRRDQGLVEEEQTTADIVAAAEQVEDDRYSELAREVRDMKTVLVDLRDMQAAQNSMMGEFIALFAPVSAQPSVLAADGGSSSSPTPGNSARHPLAKAANHRT